MSDELSTVDARRLRRREYLKAWKARNPDKIKIYARTNRERNAAQKREYNRQYRNKNPEYQAHVARYAKEYRRRNIEYFLEYNRNYNEANSEYRLEYSRMYKETHREEILLKKRLKERAIREAAATRPRPELCEVCGKPPNRGKSLHYDHCHMYGKFRGWLCGGCNVVLGIVGDDPKVLDALAAYLRSHGDE